VRFEPGNTIAAKHGAYSPLLRELRAQEIAEGITAAPHIDQLGRRAFEDPRGAAYRV
jgi:hypothetical protein